MGIYSIESCYIIMILNRYGLQELTCRLLLFLEHIQKLLEYIHGNHYPLSLIE